MRMGLPAIVVALWMAWLGPVLASTGAVTWAPNTEYVYAVDSKTWSEAATPDFTVSPSLVKAFSPPIKAQNFGFRCQLRLLPVVREVWAQKDRGSADGTNAWLLQAHLDACVLIQNRYHGPYIPMPNTHGDSQFAMDPVLGHASTPFYFIHTDDGRVRELYFFGNETLPSRNFKRGMVSFANFVRSVTGGSPSAFAAVDHNEQGMYVAPRTL